MLVRDALTRFLAYVTPRLGLEGRDNYRALAREWEKIWGGREVADVKAMDIEERYLARLALGLSGPRLNSERFLLRRFFRWAKTHELCAGDPTVTWPRHPDAEREARIVPDGVEKELIPLLPEWCRRYLAVSLYTGIRQGTARKLDWNDVQELGGGRALVIPPTKMKMRKALTIPLSPEADRWLGARPQGGGPLFPGLRARATIWYHVNKAGRQLGLDPLPSPHDFRKTAATRLLKRGIPAPMVMKMFGWRKMSVMLLNYMGEVSVEEGRAAFAQIAD